MSAVLDAAAKKLGLDAIYPSTAMVETHTDVAGTTWRVRIVNDGKPLVYTPASALDEELTTCVVYVSEREVREAEA